MSEIRLISTGLPELLPQRNRSVGLHVSTIISDICIRNGYYEESTVLDTTLIELGKALERALITGYELEFPDEFFVPGEIERDGIYGTPDLLRPGIETVLEFKYTWRSSHDEGYPVELGEVAHRDHPIYSDKFWKDWAQAKAYCAMLGWNRAQLGLCHPKGDYRQFKSVYNLWEQVLTDKEREVHWDRIKRHGDKACRDCFRYNCEHLREED